MPSAQDCAERLREQAYRTLLPQIRDLEQELQNFSNSLSSGVDQIERRLDALRKIELPTTEAILSEVLEEVKLQKEQDAGALAAFAYSLRRKETQEEILTFLLDSAQRYFSRVALFAVRGDRFLGWSSRGYSEAKAREIGSCAFSRSECRQLEDALGSENPVTASELPDNHSPLNLLQDQAGEQWHLMPLRALQRPVALLLASGNGIAPSGADAVAVLAELTSLRLENLALKVLYELTAEKAEAATQPLREEVPAAASASTEAFVPIPSAAPAMAQEEAAVQAAPALETVVEEEPVEAPEAETIPVSAPAQPSAPQEEMPVEAAAAIPAPEPARVQPQVFQPAGEEEKLHADAKRFARLLVSEIKLYNEHHVMEGRENRDLYLRLKRDIDRSREMYEKRVSPTVARRIDYFHDEIIRILGDNDPTILGSDYPGPRVES